MTRSTADWDSLLEPGEVILWQGQPDTQLHLSVRDLPLVLFGVFFGGCALIWIWLAARAGGYFWVFGLPFLLVGLIFSALAPIIAPLQRRATWYTLTNRRAFVATDLPVLGPRLDAYPILSDTPLHLHQQGALGSVHFATRRITNSRMRVQKSPLNLPVGFERIRDADHVMTLIKDVRRDAPKERS